MKRLQLQPEVTRAALKQAMNDLMKVKKTHFFPTPAAAAAWTAKMKLWTPICLEILGRYNLAQQQLHMAKSRCLDAQRLLEHAEANSRSREKPELNHLKVALKAAELRVSLRDKQLEDVRKELKEHTADHEKPEPVINTFKIPAKVFQEEEQVEQRQDGVILRGSEFLGQVVTPAATPGGGGSLFAWPLSPASFGGSRLQAFSQLYDMFKIISLFFEYVPITGSAVPGAVAGYSVGDVMDDPCSTRSGDVVTRDAVSRNGAETNQIFRSCVYGIALPQQSVYFTTNQENPNLMFAGLFSLIEVNAIAPSTNLGLIIAHYEIEFLMATSVRFGGTAARTPTDGNIGFAGQGLTINQAFYVTISNSGTLALQPGEVGEAVVTTVVDAGNPVAWRSLRTGDDRATVIVAQGIRLWFRLDSQNANVLFYPSLGAALVGHDAATDPGTPSDAYINSVTTVIAGAPTLMLTNIKIWFIPGSTI